MSIEDELGNEPEDSLPDPAEGDRALIEAVSQHFERVLGPIETVYHEHQSRFVHIDVHRLAALDGVCTFFTTGLAERAMNVPANVPDPEQYRYAELVLHLPGDWPVDWDELQQKENWWPIQTLIALARLPHERESWLWGGHTLLNGDTDPIPYAADVGFCAALVCPSYLMPEDSEVVSIGDGRDVVLFTVAFLYPEEYRYCIQHHSEAFLDKVQESGLSPADFFVLDKERPNICADGACD